MQEIRLCDEKMPVRALLGLPEWGGRCRLWLQNKMVQIHAGGASVWSRGLGISPGHRVGFRRPPQIRLVEQIWYCLCKHINSRTSGTYYSGSRRH